MRHEGRPGLLASLPLLRVSGSISLHELSSQSDLRDSRSGAGSMGFRHFPGQRVLLSFARGDLDRSVVSRVGFECAALWSSEGAADGARSSGPAEVRA